MKKYLTTVAQKDARSILGHTARDIKHVFREAANDVVPFQDGVALVDERLMALYMQSVRVSRFAAEALRAERRTLMRKLQRRHESEAEKQEQEQEPAVVFEGSCTARRKQTVSSIVDILPLKVSASESLSEDMLVAESSLKQLKKDIERDRLIVNGKVVVGSEAKLQGCMDVISDVIDSALLECALPLLSQEGKDILVFCLLRNLARTHSGGVTFQALHAALDVDATLIVPVSASARPLRVLVSVGAYPTNKAWKLAASLRSPLAASIVEEDEEVYEWGLKCFIQASTVFVLKAVDAAASMEHSESDVDIQAVYDDSFYVPVDPSEAQITKDVVLASLASSFYGGDVTMYRLNREESI